MKTQLLIPFVLLVLVATILQPAHAVDRVYRKGSDTPLQGTIDSITKTGVSIKSSSKSQAARKVPANEITQIRWDKEPAIVNQYRTFEQNGRFAEAIAGYEKTLAEVPATQANLKDDLAFLIARSNASLAITDPSQINNAIKKMEAYRKANPSHFRYYESLDLLVRLYLAKKDYTQTAGLFADMKKAPWPDYKMGAQNYESRVKLNQGDVVGALSGYEGVIAQPAKSPLERARRSAAMLGKASCLQKQNQLGPAAKLLQETVSQIPEDDSATLAETYLRIGDILKTQAGALRDSGDAIQALHKSKEAAIAYLHIDVLEILSRESALHAEALYNLSQIWKTLRQSDRAAEAAAKLKADYPNSEWAKKLGTAGS